MTGYIVTIRANPEHLIPNRMYFTGYQANCPVFTSNPKEATIFDFWDIADLVKEKLSRSSNMIGYDEDLEVWNLDRLKREDNE